MYAKNGIRFYELITMNSLNLMPSFPYIFLNISISENNNAKQNRPLYSEFLALQDDIPFATLICVSR